MACPNPGNQPNQEADRGNLAAAGPAPEVSYITAYVCISPPFAIFPHTFPDAQVYTKAVERMQFVISIRHNMS